MVTLNRRLFALGGSTLAGLSLWPVASSAASLNDPSPIGEMVLGPEDAKVTVIEYASASCPHCANFYKTTFQDLKKDYIDTGKIRFIFREFPHNQQGLAAFMLARCAPKDKYFPIVDMLFEQQEKWLQSPRDELFKIAQLAGFTQESFDACLKNEEVAKGIIAVRDQAEGFGVDSIPTFFVNGEKLKGETSIEEFRKIIDPLLA
ncbi:MAG: DsbA family protein [Rhizobiales bacterium]|nr:DsbA family protein [Hyphomicrobiales bacterium]